MSRRIIIPLLFLGFLANEAQAYEAGIGIGRINSCMSVFENETRCSSGPSLNARWGFNLWGKGYDVDAHEKPSSTGTAVGDSFANNYSGPNFLSSAKIDSVSDLVIVIAVSLVFVSIGYALLYPFSSRADMGFIGRASYQDNPSMTIRREDVGLYFRTYFSQHFPVYIYGSGVFSSQKLDNTNYDGNYSAFVKSVGLGIMSPERAGLYFQGVWESGEILNPSVKDVIEDSTTNHLKGKSLKSILDASHFELGYLWYY